MLRGRRMRVSMVLIGLLALLGTGKAAFAETYKGTISADELEQKVEQESSERVVLLNFWATWCAPCRRELPELADLRREFASEDVLILSVSLDYNSKAVTRFVEKFGLNFPVYRDDGEVAQRFEVAAVPKMMLYDERGMFMEHAGYVPPKRIRQVVRKALGD